MTDQAWLWGNDGLPPYQRHSDTSRTAAVAVASSGKPHIDRERVMNYLMSRGDEGATDEEMQNGIPLAQNSQRPRRIECCQGGLVRDSGRTRKTKSGRKAVVWVVT